MVRARRNHTRKQPTGFRAWAGTQPTSSPLRFYLPSVNDLLRQSSLLHRLTPSWLSSWFFAAPSRATMAGLPPLPPLWRSKSQLLRNFANEIQRLTLKSAFSPNMLLSGSRDKTLIIWNLTRDEQAYGYPKRSLEGHSHIVSDCVCPRILLPSRFRRGY